MSQTKTQLLDGRDSPLTFPSGNGTNGQYLQTNGSGALSWATVSTSNLTRGTAVTLTNQTSVTFTGIPSTARRVVLILDRVNTVSSSNPICRIGDSGGIETTGYESANGRIYGGGSSGTTASYETGSFRFNWGGTNASFSGIIELVNTTGNKWVLSGELAINEQSYAYYAVVWASGSKELSDTLDRVQLTTQGAVTLDAGVVNIFYEV